MVDVRTDTDKIITIEPPQTSSGGALNKGIISDFNSEIKLIII